MFLYDFLHAGVAGAVHAVHPDAGFHPGFADGLDGVLPAARVFAFVPVQPIPRRTAVAMLVAVVELHVVVAEVGKMLLNKHLQHRVECFLRKAPTVRPPGAVTRNRALPYFVSPRLVIFEPFVFLVEPRAEDEFQARPPALPGEGSLLFLLLRRLNMRVTITRTDQDPVPVAVVHGIVPQIMSRPDTVADVGEAFLRLGKRFGRERLVTADDRTAQDQFHALL